MTQCSYCKTCCPTVTADYPCGTRLILLSGEWFSFCESCGDDPQYARTNGETGKKVTLAQYWESCLHESNPAKDMGFDMVLYEE